MRVVTVTTSICLTSTIKKVDLYFLKREQKLYLYTAELVLQYDIKHLLKQQQEVKVINIDFEDL